MACSGLCAWVREIYKYHVLSRAVAEATRQELSRKPVPELLTTSRAALDGIAKKDLQELKSLSKPPKSVALACNCLLHLFAGISPNVEVTQKRNVKDLSWKSFQKLCNNPDGFLADLVAFPDEIDANRVAQKNIEKARRIKDGMGRSFSVESMNKRSKAASCLCTWVTNIIAYYDLVSPRRSPAPILNDANQHTAASAPCISKAGIVELKALAKPPVGVDQVVMAVAFLLGHDTNYDWNGCKQLLADMKFLDRLMNFDIQQVSPSHLAQAKAISQQPAFRSVGCKSKAAEELANWVLGVFEIDLDAVHASGA
jgi:hypothetical protein